MKPQNQVTVRSSETDLVFQINRKVAEKHDTLVILDGKPPKAARKGAAKVKSVDKQADPIAAPVADDN